MVTSRNAQATGRRVGRQGNNLLPDLLAHQYVGDFELPPFKGFTKPHSLTLDFGEPYRGGPLRLLMHGEIEYFTANGMYAASQAGIEATAPYVQKRLATIAAERPHKPEKWVRVSDDMGFPAGCPEP